MSSPEPEHTAFERLIQPASSYRTYEQLFWFKSLLCSIGTSLFYHKIFELQEKFSRAIFHAISGKTKYFFTVFLGFLILRPDCPSDGRSAANSYFVHNLFYFCSTSNGPPVSPPSGGRTPPFRRASACAAPFPGRCKRSRPALRHTPG